MALNTMYPGINNSPKTTLTVDITAAANSIQVADASVLPAGPNIAVIGSAADAEVVLYETILNNTLTRVTRGIGGTSAKAWDAETVVARNFTMYDYKTLCDNINDLESRKMNTADAGDLAAKDTVDLLEDVENALPIANGGTGGSTAASARQNLGLGSMATKSSVALASDVSGTLPVANGGTGVTSNPSLQVNLASGSAAGVFASAPRPGVTGQLPVANGGTGANSASSARTNLGLTGIAVRPDYQISTTDLGENKSLTAGKIYFYVES